MNRKALLRAVTKAAGATDTKGAVAILAGVLVDGTSIAATNTQLTYTTTVEDTGIRAAVHAKRFVDALSTIETDDVKLKLNEETLRLTISGGRRRLVVPCWSADEFPSLPASPETTEELDAKLALEAISRTKWSISHEEHRAHVSSLGFSYGGAVATNGKSLVVFGKPDVMIRLLIPRGHIPMVEKVLEGKNVRAGVASRRICFANDEERLLVLMPDAVFPPWSAVLPEVADDAWSCRCETAAFLSAVRALKFGVSESADLVTLAWDSDMLHVSTTSIDGEAEDTVIAPGNGFEGKLGTDWGLLRAALEAAPEEEVSISVTGELDPMLLRSGDQWKAILMPRRVDR